MRGRYIPVLRVQRATYGTDMLSKDDSEFAQRSDNKLLCCCDAACSFDNYLALSFRAIWRNGCGLLLASYRPMVPVGCK
jgi:hypothetical protein